MYYNEEDVKNLIDRLNIVDVVIKSGVELHRTGSNYKGLCPFHQEDTASFIVSPHKNIYKCFGCGEKGGSINYYMKYYSVDFKTAIEKLAKEYNVELRIKANKYYDNSKNESIEKIKLINEITLEYYRNNLINSSEANQYLINREIPTDIMIKYELGYALNEKQALYKYLKSLYISDEDMLNAGVIVKGIDGKYYDFFQGRIMFPIRDYNNILVGFSGRTIICSHIKYLNTPENSLFKKKELLYGLLNRGEHIRKHKKAILAEGYLDVITAHVNTLTNTVCSMGTALTNEQISVLKKCGCDEVIIAFDMDEAGRNAAERAGIMLKKMEFHVRVVDFSEDGLVINKDIDEYARMHGLKQFLIMMNNKPKEFFDFYFEKNVEKYNMTDLSDKRRFIEDTKILIDSCNNKIDKLLYVDKFVKVFGLVDIDKHNYINKYLNI